MILEYLYIILLFLNLPLAIAGFIFSYILLRRVGDAIYFNFGMSTLFLSLWLAVGQLMYFFIIPLSKVFIVNLTFLFGIWILHYFLVFTYHFPKGSKVDPLKIIALYLLTLIVSASFFLPNLYTQDAYLDFPFLYVKINPLGLSIFTIYFILLVMLSFKNLILKYVNSDGIFRIQLRKIIYGTAIAVVANIFFSITIYYFTNFNTNVIGSFFTFTVLIYIYSILFSKNIGRK